MDKIKFTPDISISHIILAITFLAAAVAWKGSVEHKIEIEGRMRETKDIAITVEMRRITEILNDIEARVRLNERHVIEDEAKGKQGTR